MRSGLRALSEIARFDEEARRASSSASAAPAPPPRSKRRTRARAPLVLERASGGGGTSAMSGGVLYLGGGTTLQRACGFEDSPEAMFAYLMASVGDAPDEAKMRLYCEGSVAHYDWLVAQGVPFKPIFYYGVSGEPPTDDGLVWSGSERCHPFCDVAKPAPRGHVPQHPHQTGHVLMKHLIESARGERRAHRGRHARHRAGDGRRRRDRRRRRAALRRGAHACARAAA